MLSGVNNTNNKNGWNFITLWIENCNIQTAAGWMELQKALDELSQQTTDSVLYLYTDKWFG